MIRESDGIVLEVTNLLQDLGELLGDEELPVSEQTKPPHRVLELPAKDDHFKSDVEYTSFRPKTPTLSHHVKSIKSGPCSRQVEIGMFLLVINDTFYNDSHCIKRSDDSTELFAKIEKMCALYPNFGRKVHYNLAAGEIMSAITDVALSPDSRDCYFVIIQSVGRGNVVYGCDGVPLSARDILQAVSLTNCRADATPSIVIFDIIPDEHIDNGEGFFLNPSHAILKSEMKPLPMIDDQIYLWVERPLPLVELFRSVVTEGRRKDVTSILDEFYMWTYSCKKTELVRYSNCLTRLLYLHFEKYLL